MVNQSLKAALLWQLHGLLDERIAGLEQSLTATRESRDSDTKSSAGDKYETGREMAQQEMDKQTAQLAKTHCMKRELTAIKPETEKQVAEFGSLVVCDSGNYFISIPLGQIDMCGCQFFCLSLASPLGQALAGRRPGDKLLFNGKTFRIERIE